MKNFKDDINHSHIIHNNNSKGGLPLQSHTYYRPISAANKRPDQGIKLQTTKIKQNFPNVFNKGVSMTEYNLNLTSKGHISTTLEKEKLFEETLQLKNVINSLKKELSLVKSENVKKEQEISKKDKVIEDIAIDSSNNLYGSSSNSAGGNTADMLNKAKDVNLLIKMKKQFKELKKELKMKIEEGEKLKKLLKITKFNELTIEIKTLTDELSKIKTLYQHSLQINEANENRQKEVKELQDNFNKQHFIIITLQENLAKMEEISRQKDQEINKLLEATNEKANQLKKSKKDLQFANQIIEKLNKDKKENGNDTLYKSKYELQMNEIQKEMNRYRDMAIRKESQLRDLENTMKKMGTGEQNKANTFNYNDVKYFQENPEEKADNNILLLKSKLQELSVENKRLIQRNKKLELKFEIIEKKIGYVVDESQLEDEEEEKNNNKNTRYSKRENEDNSDNDPLKSNRFTEDQLTEFTYILIKNFEAKKINLQEAKKKIFKEEVEGINSKIDIVQSVSNKICDILKANNSEERRKIVLFINTIFSLSENNQEIFAEKFLSLFANVKTYTPSEEKLLGMKLKKYLKSSISYLRTAFKNNDEAQTGCISFQLFRRILESIQLRLKDKYIEYLIYIMKSEENKNFSIYDLKYDPMFRIIDEAEDDPKSVTSEELGEDDYLENDNFEDKEEESEIVITTDQFNEKVNKFCVQLSEYLKRNNLSVREMFNDVLFKPSKVFSDSNFKNISDDVVELKTFINYIKNMRIELSDLDVYCLFTKFKIIEDLEAISINLLENELKNNSFNKKLSSGDLTNKKSTNLDFDNKLKVIEENDKSNTGEDKKNNNMKNSIKDGFISI